MNKKLLAFVLLVLLSFTLTGCDIFDYVTTNTTTSTSVPTVTSSDVYDLDSWLNSDSAVDLNGDRKINEEDFEMYLLQNIYEYWRKSDYALDNNGDRKINEEDFEIYRLQNNYYYWESSEEAYDFNDDSVIDETDYDIYLNYDIWRYSSLAEDLNDDSEINVDDYEIYAEYAEFVGTYSFTDYEYVGNLGMMLVGDDGVQIMLTDLGKYITQFVLTVYSDGSTSVSIPSDIQVVFGSIYQEILEGAKNLTISRISPYIVSIDSFVVTDNVETSITLYLNEIENGYHVDYAIGENSTMSFDIIKN